MAAKPEAEDGEQQQAEGEGPAHGLAADPGQGLHQQRIGNQRGKAAKVGGGVEEVGIRRMLVVGAGKPALEERAIGGDGEEGQADGHREGRDQPQRGEALRWRVAEQRQDGDRHGQERQRHDREMDGERVGGFEAGEEMGIGIAGEQRRLEEHHRHRPDGRCAAEPRQDHLGEHRLDGEEEQGGEENGRGEDRQQESGGGEPLDGRLDLLGGRR